MQKTLKKVEKKKDYDHSLIPSQLIDLGPIILSLSFKINLIFYLIKEFMKNSCINFFYEIINKISNKVKMNSKI